MNSPAHTNRDLEKHQALLDQVLTGINLAMDRAHLPSIAAQTRANANAARLACIRLKKERAALLAQMSGETASGRTAVSAITPIILGGTLIASTFFDKGELYIEERLLCLIVGAASVAYGFLPKNK